MTNQSSSSPYDSDFFNQLREGSQRSAEIIVPLILEWIQPKSVVDIGCGDGSWLAVFQNHGVDQILGLDGNYVEAKTLQIPAKQFVPCDLTQPIFLGRTFDLAVSLEVAEHLPEVAAQGFVESLTQLSQVVLFSAAIPHQGGTGHINEQWPDYWIERFAAQDYFVIDALRPQIWACSGVEPWYAQNIFLFIRSDCLQNYPNLQRATAEAPRFPMAVVHPTIYLNHCPVAENLKDENTETASPNIEILGVSLFPSTEVKSGERVIIELSYQIAEPLDPAIKAIIVCLSISSDAEIILLETETIIAPLPSDRHAPHTLRLQIHRLDLVEGDYFVNPGLFSTDWTQTFDFHWHRYPLSVRESTSKKGYLNLPMQWCFDDYESLS